MGRVWKYPQIVLLLIGCALAAYSAIDFSRPTEYIEAYRGPFGPWTLRLAAPERSRPGEPLKVVVWVSSPAGRPSYERLLLHASDGNLSTKEVELRGGMLMRRGSLDLPVTASTAWSLHVRAEMWGGGAEEVVVPLSPLIDETHSN
jgi:hypothetical protein